MKTIRKGIFETNSSSTHAIVVSKEKPKEDDIYIDFSWDRNYGFGREECRLIENIDEKIAYIWAIIINLDSKYNYPEDYYSRDFTRINKFEQNVKNIFKEDRECFKKSYYGDILEEIDNLFEYLREKVDDYDIYVDHCECFKEEFNKEGYELLERFINDKDYLEKFLLSRKSYITVGGDEFRGYNIKTIGFEYDYEDYYEGDDLKGEFWNKLEEYEKENDVFLKGN